MLEKRVLFDIEEKDSLMLEQSVRMDVGAYRNVVFLRISLLFDVREKRLFDVGEKSSLGC